ncbi:MAG: nucleotidyltransferase [Candidatus Villigracilaceae bacterium]
MSPSDYLEPLLDAIDALQRLLSRFDNRGVIIGGTAVSILGRARFTEDVDAMFLLSNKDLPRLLEMAKEEGIEPRQLRLPTPEDLIIMKAIAHRPKDLEDIRTLANKYPNLDMKRIEEWVKAFGEVLETPELWEMVKPLLG